MRKLFVAVLLSCCSSLASAKVLNVEFNFTPFVGDHTKAEHVETVPGKAMVFINNVPMVAQEIGKQEVPVLFDDREVAASIFMSGRSMGPALRKGKNKLRVEFVPSDPNASYNVQLRWASVTDQVTKSEDGPGRFSATNQADEGADNQKVLGKAVLEREFDADFASDQAWHHYPPVTELTDGDKQALSALVTARVDAFKPDFSAAYQLLSGTNMPGVRLNVAGIKKSKIFHKAYKAGIRFIPMPADQLEFVATGNQEVLIRSKAGAPYEMADRSAFERVKVSAEEQFGLAMVLAVLYPPQLIAVRDPAGKWTVAYGSSGILSAQ